MVFIVVNSVLIDLIIFLLGVNRIKMITAKCLRPKQLNLQKFGLKLIAQIGSIFTKCGPIIIRRTQQYH